MCFHSTQAMFNKGMLVCRDQFSSTLLMINVPTSEGSAHASLNSCGTEWLAQLIFICADRPFCTLVVFHYMFIYLQTLWVSSPFIYLLSLESCDHSSFTIIHLLSITLLIESPLISQFCKSVVEGEGYSQGDNKHVELTSLPKGCNKVVTSVCHFTVTVHCNCHVVILCDGMWCVVSLCCNIMIDQSC